MANMKSPGIADKSAIDRTKLRKLMEKIGIQPEYPCDTCRRREMCSDTTFCKRWREWFRASYNSARFEIRRRARRGN